MARYTGPVCRICRRQGEKLMLKGDRCIGPKCAMEKRSFPPGQRFPRRRKVSDRGLQLMEKQKVRHSYGVLERQFRKYFAEAERRPGITGENLLRILEMRLDNVVYRLGFADSRPQARQLVRHGHIALNGHRTDIPSCAVKTGDAIGWVEGSVKKGPYQMFQESIEGKYVPSWLSLDKDKALGHVLSPPQRSDIDARFDENAIVEYYSR